MTELQSLPATSASRLQQKQMELKTKRTTLLTAFTEAAESHHGRKARRVCGQILELNEFLQTLEDIEAERTDEPAGSASKRFTVSSLFLHDCFKKLTADGDEQFVFITGSETADSYVLDQLIELKHEKRTMLGVTADSRATHGLLIRLERFGHRLLAHFHSHPGNGPDSTRPSGTDENFQRRLESAGHVAVCAIFSRDGFVRFLRLDDKLEVDIFGKGVEQHEANVFRLTDFD